MEDNLYSMAEELFECKTLEKKQEYLIKKGRVQHIMNESGYSWALSEADPDRFINVGSNFYYRKPNDTIRKYNTICLNNGKYIYEHYPLIFEFYDELMNGITYEVPKEITKRNK